VQTARPPRTRHLSFASNFDRVWSSEDFASLRPASHHKRSSSNEDSSSGTGGGEEYSSTQFDESSSDGELEGSGCAWSVMKVGK